MNLFDMLKADKGIPVSDPMARLWGYQYQQKHGVSEISGVPPLRFMSRGGYLQDYRIYGNTVQNGTPTPENPVEVQGVGEYDAELNGYKIPVTVSDGTNSITTPVYIGTEPLHKIGDYADYVDYKRGVVVRRIKKLALTGDENITSKSGNAKWHIPLADMKTPINTNAIEWYCSHYRAVANNALWSSYDYMISWSTGDIGLSIGLRIRDIDFLTGKIAADLKSYLAAQYEAGTPVTVWYVLANPEEEPLENLLPIQTIKGSDVLTADTTVQPSEMYIKGKIKPIGGNEND